MHGCMEFIGSIKCQDLYNNFDLTIVMQILKKRDKVPQHFLNDKQSSIQKANSLCKAVLSDFDQRGNLLEAY